MYASRIDDQDLTFVVSGMLWNESLVMMDTQSKTLWSHLLGKAMKGPLQGKRLRRLVSTVTTWGEWRSLHPDTTAIVMRRTAKIFHHGYYQNLNDFVLGAEQADVARAWSFSQLIHRPIINDEFAGQPVLVTFEARSKTARLFSRDIADRILTFEMKGTRVVDVETQSTWSLRSGEAVGGPLKETQLKLLPSTVSFHDAWRTFYPQTTIYGQVAAAKAAIAE